MTKMIRILFPVFLFTICFVSPSLHAQDKLVVHKNGIQKEHQSDHVVAKKKELAIIEFVFDADHDHTCEKNHSHDHDMIVMSLEEILSSDDIIDFNCTGGFCMKKSHTHKKGLSTQRQLFDYFMRIST